MDVKQLINTILSALGKAVSDNKKQTVLYTLVGKGFKIEITPLDTNNKLNGHDLKIIELG